MKTATSTERLNELFDRDSRNDSAIADALGVSKQAICLWRNGQRSPKKSMMMKIADIYNVDIGWLMGFDDPPDDPTQINELHTMEAKILARGIDKLPKAQREQALSMFKLMFAPQYAELFNKGEDDDT